MAKTSRKRFPCGHKGLGKFCHRCDQADKLEELSKAGKTYVDHKKRKKPHKWTKEEMIAEVERLRKEGKGRY